MLAGRWCNNTCNKHGSPQARSEVLIYMSWLCNSLSHHDVMLPHTADALADASMAKQHEIAMANSSTYFLAWWTGRPTAVCLCIAEQLVSAVTMLFSLCSRGRILVHIIVKSLMYFSKNCLIKFGNKHKSLLLGLFCFCVICTDKGRVGIILFTPCFAIWTTQCI